MRGSMRSKSRSACMRSTSTEPTMPRHPIMPTLSCSPPANPGLLHSTKLVRRDGSGTSDPALTHQCHSAATTASPISCVPTCRRARLVDIRRAQALWQHLLHRGLDPVRPLVLVERVAQHHGRRQDRRQRIREILAGDIGRRAVDRLVEALAALRRAKPKAACRSSPSAWTPRPTGCRRTCCR